MEKGEGMKTRNLFGVITFVAICGLALSSQAQLVSNTFNTGVRTYPAAPTYSEMGFDSNTSVDLESAWFVGGSGTLGAQVGTLMMSNAASSTSYTTYFTPESTPVTLSAVGDQLKVTWVFTPRNVNTSNTSQGFILGIVDSPSAARLTVDGSPGSAVYAGYSMRMNMGNTLKNSNPFGLYEWAIGANSGALLSASGNWALLANGIGSPVLAGYVSGTQYTYTMTMTLLAGGNLELISQMSGAGLAGSGAISVTFTDSSPNSLTFDTFGLRPSTIGSTADSFDTTLFQVEGPVIIPEPSTLLLVSAGFGLMIAAFRRRRS